MRYPLLKPGATIGLFAPSSHQSKEKIEEGIVVLQSLGFQVVTTPSCFAKDFIRLSGPDDQKISDLHDLFSNPDIDAIICTSGGYGTPRIVDRIDFDLIALNPKVFVGFSDVTLLLNAIMTKCDMVTYHGPMIVGDFSRGANVPHVSSFLSLVQGASYTISAPEAIVLQSGNASGIVVGGNLSLLQVLAASNFCFDPVGKVLLIEEVHEANYRIDRMLQTLRLAGLFEGLNGVLIGGITGSETPQEGSIEVFQRFFQDALYPVLFGVPIGHVIPRYSIPIGGTVVMDTTNKTILVQTKGLQS